MTTPKDERTWEEMTPGEQIDYAISRIHELGFGKVYDDEMGSIELLAAIEKALHTHTTALAEEVERKVVELFLDCELRNYRVEHTDVVAIIRSTLTPDNKIQ
jgi:hypothetical protein